VVLLVAFAVWIGWKFLQRSTFYRSLKVARVDVATLHARLGAGEAIAIVDIRHAIELRSDARTLPGALLAPLDEIVTRLASLPKDREIVLYCA
jgi:rhodanese-related sulfurtransferase